MSRSPPTTWHSTSVKVTSISVLFENRPDSLPKNVENYSLICKYSFEYVSKYMNSLADSIKLHCFQWRKYVIHRKSLHLCNIVSRQLTAIRATIEIWTISLHEKPASFRICISWYMSYAGVHRAGPSRAPIVNCLHSFYGQLKWSVTTTKTVMPSQRAANAE